ncbi:acyltransferase 3 [Penicillium atrosanguineum]|uniref:acyltransferase 3 n=1 Tax=Penicillium atrosanguineum TaxID=1132637 RepID=UPI00239CDFD9|nr:acyltransferase 3 [Penicillium atrosanguineum]KAJ5296343.1 acyltransferase 3 [Penicillium atrosanguineum]
MAKRTLDAFFKPAVEAASKKLKTEPDTPPEPTGPPDTHASYPTPIPQLPSHITVSLEHGTPAREGRRITDQPDLDLLYFQPYITRTTANELFKFLRRDLPFYRVQYNIKRGGVETSINTPRYTTVFGVDETATFIPRPEVNFKDDYEDDGGEDPETLALVNATSNTPISPSKYQYTPRPIPKCLDGLRRLVESATSSKYNFCLVNYYASGNDSIAFHSDDERFLGSSPCIASLSLGGEREFVMKHKPPSNGTQTPGQSHVTQKGAGRPAGQLKMPLASGDMVIMRGSTQANWLHSIPKRKAGGGGGIQGRINITFRRAVVPAGTNNYYNYNVGCGRVWRWDEGVGEMVEQRDKEEEKDKKRAKKGTKKGTKKRTKKRTKEKTKERTKEWTKKRKGLKRLRIPPTCPC